MKQKRKKEIAMLVAGEVGTKAVIAYTVEEADYAYDLYLKAGYPEEDASIMIYRADLNGPRHKMQAIKAAIQLLEDARLDYERLDMPLPEILQLILRAGEN